MSNVAFIKEAVSALRDAVKAGVTAENAVVSGVRAVAFLAAVELGRKQIAGETKADGKETASKYFTLVKKTLVLNKTPIYRDSTAIWCEHVKGKQDKERQAGVNAYLKACKGMKLVGTIQDVQTFSNKLIARIIEAHMEFCRDLAREFPSEDARAESFNVWWNEYVKAETYAALRAALVKPPVKDTRAAFDKLKEAIGKIDEVSFLSELADFVAVQLELAKANRDRLDAIAGTKAESEEIDDSDVEESNVVRLAA